MAVLENLGTGTFTSRKRVLSYPSNLSSKQANYYVQFDINVQDKARIDFGSTAYATDAIGNPSDDDGGHDSGSVRIFQFISGSWQQVGSDIDGTTSKDATGYSVSLSDDGSIVAIGMPALDSGNPFTDFTVIPVAIYQWTGLEGEAWKSMAAAASVALIGLLVAMNSVAIILRQHFRKRLKA